MTIAGFNRSDAATIWNLLRMNLQDRFLGSKLGFGWAILQPLLLFSMYTFVFGFIFKARVPGAETTFAYVVWLISGYVPYLMVSEAVSATTSSVIGNTSLVKNIVFKTETLPLSAVLSGLVPYGAGLFFLLILQCVDRQPPTWHLLFLPLVLLLQILFLAGLGLILGAAAVFVRDLVHAVPTLLLLLLFFTPIFYPVDAVPALIRPLVFFNPLYQITQPYRDILIQHHCPDGAGLFYLAAVSLVLFYYGLFFFRRVKGYFETAL